MFERYEFTKDSFVKKNRWTYNNKQADFDFLNDIVIDHQQPKSRLKYIQKSLLVLWVPVEAL